LSSPSRPTGFAETLYPAVRRGVEKAEDDKAFEDVQKTVLVRTGIADTEETALRRCEAWAVTLLPIFYEEGSHDPRFNQVNGSRVGTEAILEGFLVTTDADDVIETVRATWTSGSTASSSSTPPPTRLPSST
jgi:hypothetical protein